MQNEEEKKDESILTTIRKLNERKKRCGIILLTYLTKPRKFVSEGMAVLLVRGRDSGIWSLPKGVMNDWETEEQCAVREMYEETGIQVMLEKENPRLEISGNIYFLVNIIGNDMSDEELHDFEKQQLLSNDEIDSVKWISFKDMQYFDCNKDLRILQTMKKCPEMKRYVVKNTKRIQSIISKELGDIIESMSRVSPRENAQ